MKRKDVKKKPEKQIDSIEDKQMLKEDAPAYATKRRKQETEEDDDYLTEEQIKSLDEAIAEADRGETVSFEEFKKEMSRWLTKQK